MCRDNQIGKLNESSGTIEYVTNTTESPRGIAVDPFNRCVVTHAHFYIIQLYISFYYMLVVKYSGQNHPVFNPLIWTVIQ